LGYFSFVKVKNIAFIAVDIFNFSNFFIFYQVQPKPVYYIKVDMSIASEKNFYFLMEGEV